MDIESLIGRSFEYTKEGLLGSPSTWILLTLLLLLPAIPFILAILSLLPVLMTGSLPPVTTLLGVFAAALVVAGILSAFYEGYLVKIFRGNTPLPAVSGFGTLFADGIRYIVISLVYFSPVIVFLVITIGSALKALTSMGPGFDSLLPLIAGMLASVLIALVIAFILFLFVVIGVIRFARTGAIGEAFNFSAIIATIRQIGWGTYLFALVIGIGIVTIVQMIVGVIPYIGWLVQIVISPFISVFFARYLTLLYESSEPAPPVPGPVPGQD